MDKNVVIISLATFLATLAGITFLLRSRLMKNNRKRRRSDKGLSSRQRKAINHAKVLFSQGRPVEAAKLLEAIGLTREAVNLLQESGQVDEAANVLLRLGRPNRAGVVYTRHGRWEQAVECFKMANMPLEVARCAREAGDFKTAAVNFLKTEHFAEAADCFAEQGDRKKSARYHSKAGNHNKAVEQYLSLIEDSEKPLEINFEPEELDFLVEAVVRGNTAVAFAQVLEANNRLSDAITNLIRFGNIQGAAKLYSFANEDIDQHLIDSVGISESAGKNLGDLFKYVDKPLLAAKAFEKVELLKDAARAYEEAGALNEAARCYKALNNEEKYLELSPKSGSFSDFVPEPTAKLKPSDFAGLEETKRIKPVSKIDQDLAGENSDSIEDVEDPEEDTRTLADETLEMARLTNDKESISSEHESNPHEPDDEGSPTVKLPHIDALDGSAPKSIPLASDPVEPPPISERRPAKQRQPQGPVFKKRSQDDEDVLDNRGGNLPDEKYKVKAKPDLEATSDHSAMDEVFARSKILYDLKKAEKCLLWKLGETLTYKESEILLEPNQTPRGIFFVLSGSLSVVVGPNSTNEGRREIYPGETFAAHWAFLDELIEARFIAKETTEVRVISREDMQFLLDNNGTLARKLYKNMTRQIRFDFLTNRNNKGFNQAS